MQHHGKRFHSTYGSNLEMDAEYAPSSVRWSATAGPVVGTSGTEATSEYESRQGYIS